MDDELPIGAVASRSGLAVSALRFYEQRGLITSTRTAGGQRRYRRQVLRRLAFIQAAQQVGLSLEDIREALDGLAHGEAPTAEDWRRLSESWRPRIDARIVLLEKLRDRLDRCIGCGCLSLQTCALANPQDRAAAFGPGAILFAEG
jgi:MerR family redox-sensitive transcriptional activator SoxR